MTAPSHPAVVFASGQLLTEDVWAPQAVALSPDYELLVADHTHDDTIAGMAARLLADAPARFHLVAHAMGGFTRWNRAGASASKIGRAHV